MKLNKKLELGVNAVTALKARNSPTRVCDLATEIGTTLHFLEQIMRNLRTAGIVCSVRGPGGGYVLARSQTPVTALQIANAVGSSFTATSLGDAPMSRLNKAVIDAFQNTIL